MTEYKIAQFWAKWPKSWRFEYTLHHLIIKSPNFAKSTAADTLQVILFWPKRTLQRRQSCNKSPNLVCFVDDFGQSKNFIILPYFGPKQSASGSNWAKK